MAGTPLDRKIRHVLTEARTLLPGAQALLGFELAATLADRFGELPPAAQAVHGAAIATTVLTVVLLVTPAAWHRIVERGEETEPFLRVASRLVVASLPCLALALGAQVALVTWVLARSTLAAALAGAGSAAALNALWFGLGLAARRRRSPAVPELSRVGRRADGH